MELEQAAGQKATCGEFSFPLERRKSQAQQQQQQQGILALQKVE